MNTVPNLTDRQALLRHRTRCKSDPADFLHLEAIAEIKDRLAMVNRTFTDVAIVTGFPDIWASAFPDAKIVADDDVLDLTPEAHDLVIHAMSLHWSSDPVGQLIQCRRALRPDGLFLSVAFGGGTLTELRDALSKAEAQVMGGLSPRVAPMAEIRDMGSLLQRASLALPVADSLPLNVEYRDVIHLMHDLRAMGEANALTQRHRKPVPRTLFAAAQMFYAQDHPGADGRLKATFELLFLLGWAPAENQPKPLRPGSATHSLAAALGTKENPLSD